MTSTETITDKAYTLPPEYHLLEREDRFLFLDPVNFVWFVTDRTGKEAMEGLARGGRVWDAVKQVATQAAVPIDSAEAYVRSYVRHLLDIAFLHDGGYEKMEWPGSIVEHPHVLYLHLTSKCNLRCPYCYNQDHTSSLIQLSRSSKAQPDAGADKYGDGSPEDFYKVIDEAAELGFNEVKLTGGEALLNKHALSIAERAKTKGLFVNLLTNATLITTIEFAREIARAVHTVSISLDSHDAEEHDAVRGRGSHAKVLQAIRLLRDAGMNRVHLNAVVTPINLNSVRTLLEYASDELKVAEVTIAGSAINVDDPSSRWGAKGYMLTGEQYKKVQEQQSEFNKTRMKGKSYVIPRSQLRRTQCGVGNGILSVEANGDVYPCQTMHSPEHLCGNAFTRSLKYILDTSPILKKMKKLEVDLFPHCNVCPVRYICAGGCRQEAYSREGELTAWNKAMCDGLYAGAVDQLWAAATIPVEKAGEVAERYYQHASCP